MRVANTMVYNMVRNNLGDIARELNDATETTITGKRILELSDDPIGVTQSLKIRSGLDGFNQVERGISLGNSWLAASENALTQSQNLITDTKTLAIQLVNASNSPADRIAAAETVQNTMEEILSLANTKVGDRYIFSGSKTDAPAFSGPTTEVRTFEIGGSFNGADSFKFMGLGNLTLKVTDIISPDLPTNPIDVTKALANLLDGDLKQATRDFQEANPGSHAVITEVKSDGTKLTFTFAEGLDVDDTHDIDLGFVADTGGTTITVSSQVIDTEGGFDYKGDSSPFSIKIGDSTVAIGNDGEEIFSDMFQTLAELKIALETNNIDDIQTAMDEDHLDGDFKTLNVAITSVGTKMNRMDIKESIYQDLTLSGTERLSDIEDVDLAEAITNLEQKKLAYEAALSVSAKVMKNLSLLDYL